MQNAMKRNIIFSLFLALAMVVFGKTDAERLKLWYDKPAQQWVEALPVGNGRLGAMVFGKPGAERIQLNEETVCPKLGN